MAFFCTSYSHSRCNLVRLFLVKTKFITQFDWSEYTVRKKCWSSNFSSPRSPIWAPVFNYYRPWPHLTKQGMQHNIVVLPYLKILVSSDLRQCLLFQYFHSVKNYLKPRCGQLYRYQSPKSHFLPGVFNFITRFFIFTCHWRRLIIWNSCLAQPLSFECLHCS